MKKIYSIIGTKEDPLQHNEKHFLSCFPATILIGWFSSLISLGCFTVYLDMFDGTFLFKIINITNLIIVSIIMYIIVEIMLIKTTKYKKESHFIYDNIVILLMVICMCVPISFIIYTVIMLLYYIYILLTNINFYIGIYNIICNKYFLIIIGSIVTLYIIKKILYEFVVTKVNKK